MVLILNNEEVEQILTMEMCLEAMEATFRDLAEDKAVNRPRSHTYVPLSPDRYYLFKSMDGASPRYGAHALRLSSDIVEENAFSNRKRREKLPALPGQKWLGLVLLFDIHDGKLLAILQDGFLQRMRVGATSGVAAKYLSRPESRVVGLFGTGWQAGAQLLALNDIRSLERIKVYSPNPDNVTKFTQEWSAKLDIELQPVSPKLVVEGSDIVVCATNSLEPVFDGHWLQPGTHINSVAGYELDDYCYQVCSLNVVRMKEPSTHWWIGRSIPGEVKGIKKLRSEDRKKIVTLGDVITGKATRHNPEEITLFSGSGAGGSSGLGVQFAFAIEIYKRALAKGLGKQLPLDWLTETVHP
jgi:ornithine cyclodeaminase/alanine dehydrogenase-like protein (mu-crystallin family)